MVDFLLQYIRAEYLRKKAQLELIIKESVPYGRRFAECPNVAEVISKYSQDHSCAKKCSNGVE